MIREERDLAFWNDVLEHPEVWDRVSLGQTFDVGTLLDSEHVTPLASRNGGFFFVRLDGFARTFELHTAFKPEGWGKEALLAAKQAFALMFARGADVIVTQEVSGNARSQPPLSFRFQPAAEPRGGFRTWFLTRTAWEGSPARRRMYTCP